MSYPVKATGYKKKRTLKEEVDLYVFYEEDAQLQADEWTKRTGHKVKKDNFYNWVIKRGVCPYGIISSNTRYWLELMSVYDSDMGLTLPSEYKELPSVFFDVLRIYRDNRPVETPKSDNGK